MVSDVLWWIYLGDGWFDGVSVVYWYDLCGYIDDGVGEMGFVIESWRLVWKINWLLWLDV